MWILLALITVAVAAILCSYLPKREKIADLETQGDQALKSMEQENKPNGGQ